MSMSKALNLKRDPGLFLRVRKSCAAWYPLVGVLPICGWDFWGCSGDDYGVHDGYCARAYSQGEYFSRDGTVDEVSRGDWG